VAPGTTGQFVWREVTTEFREVRPTAHGDELRWLVNRETIQDTRSGACVTRAIIRHPGIAVIVPYLTADRILLVRQYRYPVDGELWELPAGTLAARQDGPRAAPTESPEACAIRELVEETGYEASEWEKVIACYAMPGGNDGLIHVFLARGLSARAQALDPGEVIREVRPFETAELERMIRRGEIRDAKTLIGLLLALGRRPGGVRIAG
jgi:ADP-ribose diphosphatase